mmetsp:Transcript_19905/g.55260  ORF Transcript_19905/g.55260 Transcript_19905/m.55260 type:complete len:139 (+) Transcript_19905:554-970(+)
MQSKPSGVIWVKTKRRNDEADNQPFVRVQWATVHRHLLDSPASTETDRPSNQVCDTIETPIQQDSQQPTNSGETDDNQQEDDMCILCMERAPDMMLIPCGHRCFCRKCIVETICIAIRSEAPACPLCRTTIDNMVLLD